MGGKRSLSYGRHTYTYPDLSNTQMFSLHAYPIEIPRTVWDEPVVRTIGQIFHMEGYKQKRYPVTVGHVLNKEEFSTPGIPRILDMPVKLPGGPYIFPYELVPLTKTLQMIISWHHAVDPDATAEEYAFLTVEQGKVSARTTQRSPGCHVDGFQGARIQPKVKGDHTYIVADVLPTVFYPQAFYVAHMDVAREDVFHEFDRQAIETCVYRPQPYQICMIDAYTVHRGDVAPETIYRTFLRMTYSVRIFDRLGNTPNPHIQTGWEMVARDVSATLTR